MTVKGLKTQTLQTADNVSGLVLLNTTSFSGVSSFNLAASTFTSAYKNYKIVAQGTASSADSNAVYVRMRASGSDDTSSNYFSWGYERSNSAGSNFYGGNGTFGYVGAIANLGWSFESNFYDPQATAATKIVSNSLALGTNSNIMYMFGSVFKNTTSFDSATIYGWTGTITGTYSIYGYNA